MCEIPLDIEAGETIVRAIFSPYHLKGDKLRWQAFRPKPERRDVSVIRHDYVGTEECRDRAKAMSDENKQYRGFACLKVRRVRAAGLEVVDSREQFLGHADIMHVQVLRAGEPETSQVFQAVREICKQIAAGCNYHADPDPTAARWTGAAIVAPADS